MSLELVRSLLIWGVVAAVALWELAAMVSGSWSWTLTLRSNSDSRWFLLVMLFTFGVQAHLIYERWVNGR